MSIRTLTSLSMITLLGEIRFSLSRLRAEPAAAPFVATFSSLWDEGKAVNNAELDALMAVSDAQAEIVTCDKHGDRFAGRVATIILQLTDNKTKDPLYRLFFGSKAVSTFTRPVLGAELESMKKWIVALRDSNVAELVALGPELTSFLKRAHDALEGRKNALATLNALRKTGTRAQFLTKVNMARAEVYAGLEKLALADRSLGTDFPDSFFRHETRDATPAEVTPADEPTLESIEELINTLKQALADAEQKQTELKDKADKDEKDKQDRADKEKRLEELQKQQEVLQKEQDKLKAELEKSPAK